MQKLRGTQKRDAGLPRKKAEPFDDAARSAMRMILLRGFGVAAGYSDLNRNRYYVELKDGVDFERLVNFCLKQLNGDPVPGNDPIAGGQVWLRVITAAEREGLAKLTYVPAAQWVPERGRSA